MNTNDASRVFVSCLFALSHAIWIFKLGSALWSIFSSTCLRTYKFTTKEPNEFVNNSLFLLFTLYAAFQMVDSLQTQVSSSAEIVTLFWNQWNCSWHTCSLMYYNPAYSMTQRNTTKFKPTLFVSVQWFDLNFCSFCFLFFVVFYLNVDICNDRTDSSKMNRNFNDKNPWSVLPRNSKPHFICICLQQWVCFWGSCSTIWR